MVNTITYDKIETNAQNNIIEIINTRSNVADPRDIEGKNIRKFVYDEEPFFDSNDFRLLPYVYITLPRPQDVEEQRSSDGSKHKMMWEHNIIVRTARAGSSNNKTDIGKTDMLNICDDIRQTFNSNSVKNTLSNAGMKYIKLVKTSQETLQNEDGKYIYEAQFTIEYETRINVIS